MDVELFLDDEKIRLNKFVKNILYGIITGAVSSLDDINSDWEEAEIKIKK